MAVVVEKPLIVDLGADKTICVNDEEIPVTLSNPTLLPNYTWSTGELSPEIVAQRTGIYQLKTTNKCGIFLDEIQIKGCEPTIYIPNAFNPNSENTDNSVLKIFGTQITPLSLDIFDRWGNHLFHQENPIDGWNGRAGTKICEQGVYTYFVKYKISGSDDIKIKAGDVTLMK